jgi:hypothetical protein
MYATDRKFKCSEITQASIEFPQAENLSINKNKYWSIKKVRSSEAYVG